MTSTTATPDAPPLAGALAPRSLWPRGWAAAFLRVSLYRKLCLASAAVAAFSGAAVLAAAAWVSGDLTSDVVAPLATFAVVVVAGGAALNAVLVRVALSPLQRLEHVAQRVARGGLDARVPPSPLADPPMESLARTFNKMLDSVEASRLRERRLATRVLSAEERERERLARELFGGASQTMAGVLVRLQVAARRLDCDPALMAEIRDEVARGLDEIREVARRLRPPELDELGVLPALEAHSRKLTEGRRTQVTFRGHLPGRCLDDGVRLALFRIVQEALTNAVLHGHAGSVEVTFRMSAEGLYVDVADDGRGFDAATVMAAPDGNVGLLGMRERAVYAEGWLRIESSPGGGTLVKALLPWSRLPDRLQAAS